MSEVPQGYTTIDSCRVCGCKSLVKLFSLGTQYVSDFINDPATYVGNKVPIELVLCPNCTLVQAKHTAPQELLYSRHYWYRSSISATMRKALRDITQRAEEMIDLRPGDIVADLGSNDGTLLRSYTVPGIVTIGVEPATNLADEGRVGISELINDFWSSDSFFTATMGRSAKVITAIGMFYDTDNPNQFIDDVAKALDQNGVFITQLMCIKNMINVCDVGNLAHEHVSFFSIRSLEYLFGKHGLEVFDMETNSVNGESYRFYVRHKGSSIDVVSGGADRIQAAKDAEKGMDQREFYTEFHISIERKKYELTDFITGEVARSKRVAVYGSSTKGNCLTQYWGLDSSLIEFAADASPEKWGKYMVGSNIPIVSKEMARASNPDFFLILPYAFTDEIVCDEIEWLSQGDHQFLVPLPSFHRISYARLVGESC